MGRKPWEHKRDAKIAARLKVAGDAGLTNKAKEVKEAFSDARRDRHSKDGGSGGYLPSAKHVDGGMERYGSNAAGHRNNRPSLCIEGTERYDNAGPGANRPLDRYRAPSLRTKIDPVRPAIEPDYGRAGKGAPAVKARVDKVDSEIARKNLYARKGDYSGEGPALLPLPKIEVIEPYPRPEVSRAAYLKGPGLSVVELETPADGAPVFKAGPLKGRALVEPRVFKIDRLKGRRYARVRIPAKHGFPALVAAAWVPVIHRATRYHPGYDTSAWTRVRAPEELLYRALVML